MHANTAEAIKNGINSSIGGIIFCPVDVRKNVSAGTCVDHGGLGWQIAALGVELIFRLHCVPGDGLVQSELLTVCRAWLSENRLWHGDRLRAERRRTTAWAGCTGRGGASSKVQRNTVDGAIMGARIYQPAKPATQSGRFKTRMWVVEHEPSSRQEPDRLIGWIGSDDTDNQVRLRFPTREAAIAYCEQQRPQLHGQRPARPRRPAQVLRRELHSPDLNGDRPSHHLRQRAGCRERSAVTTRRKALFYMQRR